jgi:hypothetical protein
MPNIILSPPTFFVVMIELDLPFGKGCCGRPRLLRWDIGEKLGMGERLDFGRINGLARVVWLYSSGRCFL